MSIKEYNKFSEMFNLNKNLDGFFIKLNHFINFDGYDRKEFIRPRNVHFENGYIIFNTENWKEYKNQEVKVHHSEIEVFVPNNDKRSSKLPIFLRDIDFKKEGYHV